MNALSKGYCAPAPDLCNKPLFRAPTIPGSHGDKKTPGIPRALTGLSPRPHTQPQPKVQTAQHAGIPLNELDKFFYAWELLGGRPISRILFEFKGGRIDTGLLRQAYMAEIQRWPVLNSMIVENPSGPGWDVRWMPQNHADPHEAVRACNFSGLAPDEAEQKVRDILFDPFPGYSVRTNPPFSMVLCVMPQQRHKLVVFMHHAVTDAHGIGLILGELFSAYNRLSAGEAPEYAVQARGTEAPPPLLPAQPGRLLRMMLGAMAFLTGHFIKEGFQTPAKIFRGGNVSWGKTSAVQREIDSGRLARYLAAVKRANVTLNMFLVTAQIAAIDRWMRRHGKTADLISVDVHKNLRTEKSDFQKLSNKFSTLMIYTHRRHRADLKTLLQHVRREQEKAQKHSTAEKIITLLWPFATRTGGRTLRLWGNLIFKNPRMGDSSQATNVGRVWAGPNNTTLITRLGDADITGCYMAALPSPAIGNYFGYLTFNNRLYFMFIYFDWAMTDPEAREFASLFEETLEDLAACL